MSHTYVPAFTLEPEKRAAAPKPADGPRTPNFINDIAAGKVELPTIPRIVQQVAEALRDPTSTHARSARPWPRIQCSRQGAAAGELLLLRRPALDGLDRRRGLADRHAGAGPAGAGRRRGRLVRAGPRNRPADLLARLPDCRHRRPEPGAAPGAEVEQAYISGLLHGTGHLILCKTYPDIADSCSPATRSPAAPSSPTIEHENFGIDHPTSALCGSRRSAFRSRSPTRSAAPPSRFRRAPARST